MENNYLKMTRNLFLLVLLIEGCVGPPTQPKKNSTAPEEKEMTLDDLGLEYNRYLKEVVDTLESDKEFAQKLQSAKEVDFRNGKVAAELEFVSHHVRTKLDELKRTELQRLKELVAQLDEREHESKRDELHGHLDHTNPHTFEVADLHNLITKVRKDLDEADRLRKEEFKEYELQKEFEKQEKLKTLDEEHKKQYLHDLEEQKKKHEQHAPIHHPGGKAQLEEVWENVDHMENVKFDPRAFFKMHDIDSNGYWDEQEVAALFLKELEKMYEAGHPEDDLREREEEMERMREHVFKETDTNRDRLISLEEFIEQTKRQEYQRDDGWETIDQKPQFTQEEYLEFEKRRQAEIAEMQRRGLIPPYADGMGGYYQQHPGQVPPGQYGYPQYQHPNQMPQHPQMAQYPNQMPQHPGQMGQHPNQMPQHPNQMPQHPNQMPQHPNQMPQHPNQMPQHPNQMPQHPNQVPQHPNQVPQHPNQVPQHPNQMPQHPNQVPQHPNQVPQHPNQVPQHPNQVPQQVPQHPNQMPQQSNQVPQQPNQMANNPNSQYNQVPQANQGYQVNEAAHQPVQNPPQQQFQQNQQYQQQNPQVPQQNQQYQQQNQQVPQQNQQPQGQYQKYEPHSNNVASNEKSANKV